MKNLAGNVVDANTTMVQLLMDSAATRLQNATQLVATLRDDSGDYSYPIATFTYLIVRMRDMHDCDTATELCR